MMTFKEKQTASYLVSNIIISFFYVTNVFQLFEEKGLNSTDYSFWGMAILLYLPVQIAGKIVITIIFSILNAIFFKDDETGCNENDYSIKDELESLNETRTMMNVFLVFGSGLLVAMILLAIDMSIIVMFKTLLISFCLSGITGDSSQLYFYRRGV
jgi:uncharacterized membrane protein